MERSLGYLRAYTFLSFAFSSVVLVAGCFYFGQSVNNKGYTLSGIGVHDKQMSVSRQEV
jgi:hypothetical protein